MDSLNIFNPTVLILLSLISLAIIIITIVLGLKAHKAKITTGVEGMVGLEATALENFKEDFKGYKGNILANGEIWTGISEDNIKKNDLLTIIDVTGMKLSVKKKIK